MSARKVKRCRVCGCTEDDCSQCIARTGQPCHWVEPNLCSACAVLRCIYKVPAADGRQTECGQPATWRRHTVTLCAVHAHQVAVRFPLVEIGGPGELDRRPQKRIVRKYQYPRRTKAAERG